MKNKKWVIIAVAIILIVIIIAGFFYFNKSNNNLNITKIDTESTNIKVEYSEAELTGEWSECKAKITLSDEKVSIEGTGVTTSENTIKITTAGTYYITGTISDGNILVEAKETDEVQLVLDNTSITSKCAAPINGVKAAKLTITLGENSVNSITDNDNYTNLTDTENSEPDATIFTKTDLVIYGSVN